MWSVIFLQALLRAFWYENNLCVLIQCTLKSSRRRRLDAGGGGRVRAARKQLCFQTLLRKRDALPMDFLVLSLSLSRTRFCKHPRQHTERNLRPKCFESFLRWKYGQTHNKSCGDNPLQSNCELLLLSRYFQNRKPFVTDINVTAFASRNCQPACQSA